MTVTPARRAALRVLRAVRDGALVDRALARVRGRVAERDQGWLQELVLGTLRLRGRLDYLLDQRVRRGLGGVEADVLEVLRLGAYQILEMDGVPAYAAVSQSVEQAKTAGGRGAGGLVNGVLQRLEREREALEFPDAERYPIAYLESWGSHPAWLVERWVARFGTDAARQLVEANNRRPELYVRPVGIGTRQARERLAAARIDSSPVPDAPDALRVAPPATAAQALVVIPAVVQDPAAGLVVTYAAPSPGGRAAELCAAPGGKAIGLAERAWYTVAGDISFARLARVRENVRRVDRRIVDRIGHPIARRGRIDSRLDRNDDRTVGTEDRIPEPVAERGRERIERPAEAGVTETAGIGPRIGLFVGDARVPPIQPVDTVLVDAPCTGTGTLRRHPDGKWRLGPPDLASLIELQRALLDAAGTVVAPGGVLVYSTCSLEREENEDQVESFLERNPEYERAAVPESVPAGLLDGAGQLVVLPQRSGFDGAFAARLRRRP